MQLNISQRRETVFNWNKKEQNKAFYAVWWIGYSIVFWFVL